MWKKEVEFTNCLVAKAWGTGGVHLILVGDDPSGCFEGFWAHETLEENILDDGLDGFDNLPAGAYFCTLEGWGNFCQMDLGDEYDTALRVINIYPAEIENLGWPGKEEQ